MGATTNPTPDDLAGGQVVSTAAVLSGADGTDGPTPCRPSRLRVAS